MYGVASWSKERAGFYKSNATVNIVRYRGASWLEANEAATERRLFLRGDAGVGRRLCEGGRRNDASRVETDEY
jgi:hypothetical protein